MPFALFGLMGLTGAALGWLAGLSGSSIVQADIAAILGTAAGGVVVAATGRLKGMRAADPIPEVPAFNLCGIITSVDPVLVCALVVGAAIGNSAVEYSKANQLLGPNPIVFVHRWRATALPDSVIALRVFEHAFSAGVPPLGTNRSSSDGIQPEPPTKKTTR